MRLGQVLRAPEFWLLLVLSATGLAGMAWWWVVPLGVAGLSIASLPKYVELWERAQVSGVERAWWMTVVLSACNSLAVCVAAWGCGRVSGWLWLS